MGVRRPLIIRMTIGRPQAHFEDVQFMHTSLSGLSARATRS